MHLHKACQCIRTHTVKCRHVHYPCTDVRNGFDIAQDFEGWNCGEITTCGQFGQVCGGYNVKGAGSELTKTFDLPPGMYSVELDFIKIDSWSVCCVYK